MSCSITIFYRCSKENLCFWDETLGLGSNYPSGEDTMYAWTIKKDGIPIIYNKSLCVYHPYKAKNRTTEYFYRFGLGQGRLDGLRNKSSSMGTFNYWTYLKWLVSYGEKRSLRHALKKGYLKGFKSV